MTEDQDSFEELTKQVRAMRGDDPAPLPSPPPAPSIENPDTVRRLRDFLLYKASIARQNPSAFFEFVVKEETTRRPIKTAEHQKVVFDFVSNHDKSVIMMPVGHSKTYSVSSLSMFFLGQDPTLRGAIISETQGQAEKPLSMVRDYIESSQELRLVFPTLGKSERKADPWTQTAITVARPTGIRDPSLVAVGYHGAIAGARLNWIITDDILGPENTRTKQARDDVYEWFDAAVLSRLDPRNARIVVTNTAWHPDDLVHRLERIGWPTLRMDITGGIQVSNTEWDSPLIRPSAPNVFDCRLSKYDNNTPLFPERFSNQDIERLKRTHLPHRFNQLYMSQCRNNEDSRCKLEWIDRCKAKGRGISLTSFYDGPNLTVTGVDLAVSDSSTSNDTVFFTFEVLPSGERLILDVDIGKYDGPTILDKMFQKHQNYKSYIRVENNACFVPGTNVLTKEGYKPIELIQPGDMVWTHKARWKPVLSIVEGNCRTLVRVRTVGGIPVNCSPNHWFYLKEMGRNYTGRSIPVGEATWVSGGFVDKPSYCMVAVPMWEGINPTITLSAYRRGNERNLYMTDDIALLIGLFMAEGHTTRGQVTWTFNKTETHLVSFVDRMITELFPKSKVTHTLGNGTHRVIANSTQLATVLRRFGKSKDKHPPFEWYGWPLRTRLMMVRGWLMGDGCIRENNNGNSYISGSTISRNWLLFVRSTLMQAGFRPGVSTSASRKTSVIEGRTVNRLPIHCIRLNAEDTGDLFTEASQVEKIHWKSIPRVHRRSNASTVFDKDGAWSKFKGEYGSNFRRANTKVYNLVVQDDESYTVEDMIVHNAQDFVRQFALQRNMSLPIRPHRTGREKAHPEMGVEGLFIEIYNGAWIIPNSLQGVCHPNVQRFIDACLYYSPTKHTDDVLMACYFAREEAKRFGIPTGSESNQLPDNGITGLFAR